MKGAEDVESYLIQMDHPYEALGDNMWFVKELGTDLVVKVEGPVVVFRMKVLELERVPAQRREGLYRMLLELNAGDMLHGAYGLEGNAIVLTAALQLENLDFNEFQAAVDDLDMAVSKHYQTLAGLTA